MTFMPKIASTTEQEGHDHLVCPNCGTEMCGGRIYEDWAPKYHPDDPAEQARYAECYGAGPLAEAQAADPEHRDYGRPVRICGGKEIGIETPGYDGVSLWMFPCCGATYNRWTGERVKDYQRESDG